MKLSGCEVGNGTHGPQVFFSWSFNVCFVLLPGELQLSIRGPVTSICWMRSMRGNWFTNCLKQLACQLIPQTSQQENASRCLQKPSQRGFFFGTRRNQLSFGLSYRIPIWVCLKMGYTPNYSHLIGIMISKTIGFRGTQHFQTHPFDLKKRVEWTDLAQG